jgi:hypothetical protein
MHANHHDTASAPEYTRWRRNPWNCGSFLSHVNARGFQQTLIVFPLPRLFTQDFLQREIRDMIYRFLVYDRSIRIGWIRPPDHFCYDENYYVESKDI